MSSSRTSFFGAACEGLAGHAAASQATGPQGSCTLERAALDVAAIGGLAVCGRRGAQEGVSAWPHLGAAGIQGKRSRPSAPQLRLRVLKKLPRGRELAKI